MVASDTGGGVGAGVVFTYSPADSVEAVAGLVISAVFVVLIVLPYPLPSTLIAVL